MKLLITLTFILVGSNVFALNATESSQNACDEIINRILDQINYEVPMPFGGGSYVSLSLSNGNDIPRLKISSKNGVQSFNLYNKKSFCRLKSINGNTDETYLDPGFSWDIKLVNEEEKCPSKIPGVSVQYVGGNVDDLKNHGFCILPNTFRVTPVIFGTLFFLPR